MTSPTNTKTRYRTQTTPNNLAKDNLEHWDHILNKIIPLLNLTPTKTVAK